MKKIVIGILFCVAITVLSCKPAARQLSVLYFKDRDAITYKLIGQIADTAGRTKFIQAFYDEGKLVKTRTFLNGYTVEDTVMYYNNLPNYVTECHFIKSEFDSAGKRFSVTIISNNGLKRYWLLGSKGKKGFTFFAVDSIKNDSGFSRRFNYDLSSGATVYPNFEEFIETIHNSGLAYSKMIWIFHLLPQNDSISVNIFVRSPDPFQEGAIADGAKIYFNRSYYYTMVDIFYGKAGIFNGITVD